MLISNTGIILLIMSSIWSTESAKSTYSIKRITKRLGIILETPNWSVEENALYFIEFFGKNFFRLDGKTGKIETKNITCGSLGHIMPIKEAPKYCMLAINSSLYIVNFDAPDIDKSLRLYTTVDLGRPNNIIHDGKVDAKGRFWFGTLGTVKGTTIDSIVPEEASLYRITNTTFTRPYVALRPVTLSDGLVWSLNNKKMYYIDNPTRKVDVYDFDLNTGNIANKTTLVDFELLCIDGYPNGLTIDSDGNLWLATFDGRKVLRINSVTGEIMLEIELPVNQVTSIIWGGKFMNTLFITTGYLFEKSPMPDSGALFALKVNGCRGVPQNFMKIDNVKTY